MRRVTWALWSGAVALSMAGCTGEVHRGDPSVPPADGGGLRDGGGVPPVDGGPAADAAGVDAGGAGPDGGPADPCVGVRCGDHERCAAGACQCAEGFADLGAGCVALPPGDPAGRTEAEVCGRWRDGHVENAVSPWTEGATECDPGSLSREALDDALRRINLFRWLAGHGPVVDEGGRNQTTQACALVMYRNGRLSHTPDASWSCYTEAAAAGAGSSNLALGAGSAAAAIDLYMADPGTPSLGHRRWILNDPLGVVGIGFAGNAQCLGVFDASASSDRQWTAYPNPGPAPLFTASALWSFHSRRLALAGADVQVVRVGDGAALPVVVTHPAGGFGPDTVAWAPDGWTPAPGTRYRVTITGLSGGDIGYEVHLVAC